MTLRRILSIPNQIGANRNKLIFLSSFDDLIFYPTFQWNNIEMNSACELLQQSNVLLISREVARIRENNHGIKSLLAASNDECWLTTLSPTI